MSKKLLVFCVLVLGLATNTWAQVPAGVDVGNPALAGSFSYDPGTDSWTVVGCGADIWGGWDQFHYVFRPLAGDGSGVARVVSMDLTHEWAKVGVMIRESLAGNSKHMMISMTGTHGVQTVWRTETGGASSEVRTDIALPIYLKVERIGNTFNTYMTFNPAFWIPQHSVTIDMGPNVTIGMFVCSTNSGLLNTTVFDSVDLVAPAFNAAWAVQPDDGILADLGGETISWQPGDTAASHNVYFGTESPPPLIGNQTETTYDTGPLEGGTTYYYRIDEVEADGTTVHAGEERSMYTQRPGTGTITREVWEGIGGTNVWDLTNNANYPASPTWSDEITSFNVTDFADNFGSRIHGWLMPETSGDYTFWISSDDSSDLWLSTSESPADAVRIAYVAGWTCNQCWDWQASQNSTNVVGGTIPLVGGQKYYISALYKEGGGGDNCGVGWQGPDSPSLSIIDGYYLLPFENLWAWNPSPADGATGVGMTPTLSWQPAVDAVSYEVYVDGALVAETAGTSVDAGPFALSDALNPSTHVWRVDVVTNSPVRTGAEWTFTIADNRVIDDFQSYDAIPEGTAPQFAIGALTAQAPPEQEVVGGDYTIEPVEPSDDALVARYEFDADASDSSGNGFDGTLIGDATIADGVLKLDGDGDCVDIGNNPIFNPGTASFTICARVNMRSWGGNWGNVIIGKRGEGGVGWQLRRFGGDPRFSFTTRGMGNDDYPRSSIEPSLNEWHDVVAVRDGDKKYLYIDGVLDTTTVINTNPVNPCDHNVYIGARANGGNTGPEAFLDGDIDSIALYGRALSEGEVRYLAGAGGRYVPPIYGPMKLHLEFEGDLADSSGNGKDGTAVGTVGFDSDPVMGNVLSLPGGDNQYVAVPPVGISGNAPTTIACWAKADHASIPDWTLVFGFTGNAGGGGECGSHFNIGSIGGPGGVGAHAWCWEESIFDDYEALEWHHYAMTYDGTRIAYYGDGVPTDTDIGKSNVISLAPRADRVHVGSRITQASSFPGKVDDARVYDYAMSDAEIRYLAGLANKTVYGPMRLHVDFEAGADDVSGNGNEGSLRGDASVAGGVLNLDGDGDFVDYGKPDTLPTGKGPWTICGWGKANTVADGYRWIAGFGNFYTGQAMFIGQYGRALVGGGYGDDLWLDGYWDEGSWHHICLTYDGSTAAMYADGQLMLSAGKNWNLGNYYARIGRQVNNAAEFWNGQIDDVRIYDYALPDGQIAALAGKASTNPISDTWSDLGMIDFSLAAGTMKVNTYALPGLPYYVGEVSRALPFADLTEGGGKSLSTWVKCDPGNIAAIMYMSVADADGASADVTYDGDLTDGDWQEWNVDLAAFAGVDVTNAADIAIGLAGLDGGVVADSLNVDDIRVYSGRCMPGIKKPAYDLNSDCIVDVADLMILAGEFGYAIQTQDYEERAAYWDERYPFNWGGDGIAVRDGLAAAGYPVLNADQLKTWMDDRIADGKLSVVVMCRDSVPDTVAENNDANCTLRKYLDAGGKVVWFSDIPFYYQGHADGTQTTWGEDGQAGILGLGYLAVWDTWNTVTITDAGAAWGLTGTWSSLRAEHAGDVDVVLATDNSGNAAAYVKHYAPGNAAQGFVRLWDMNTAPLVADVISAAESKGYLAADLSGDGAVGWMDVILMLGEWLDEELWP